MTLTVIGCRLLRSALSTPVASLAPSCPQHRRRQHQHSAASHGTNTRFPMSRILHGACRLSTKSRSLLHRGVSLSTTTTKTTRLESAEERSVSGFHFLRTRRRPLARIRTSFRSGAIVPVKNEAFDLLIYLAKYLFSASRTTGHSPSSIVRLFLLHFPRHSLLASVRSSRMSSLNLLDWSPHM